MRGVMTCRKCILARFFATSSRTISHVFYSIFRLPRCLICTPRKGGINYTTICWYVYIIHQSRNREYNSCDKLYVNLIALPGSWSTVALWTTRSHSQPLHKLRQVVNGVWSRYRFGDGVQASSFMRGPGQKGQHYKAIFPDCKLMYQGMLRVLKTPLVCVSRCRT